MTGSTTRHGEVTMKGSPVDLAGPKLQAGAKAPDFTCVNTSLGLVSLADTAGKARLFSVIPSLDTPVCNTQTRHLSKVLHDLGDKVAAYTISLDLPFAQKRWCSDAEVENLESLSDLHNQSFGQAYGVLITSLPIPLLARALFVIAPDDTIKYVEIVPEIAQEPDYEPALTALKAAADS